MYRHILIATDGSELSGKALQAGLRLGAVLPAKVTIVTVSVPFHALSLAPSQAEYSVTGYREHIEAEAKRILGEAHRQSEAAGVASELVHAIHEHPWQAIIDTAVARGCDLITMASHGRRGAAALLLGSETLRVLTHSRIPVLVYR